MKKIVLFVMVLAVAALGLDAATGKLGILPAGDDSPGAQELRELEGRFNAAKRQVNQAMKASGLSGADTTGDIESARHEMMELHSAAQKLAKNAATEYVKKDAGVLEAAIKQYRSEMSW